MHPDVVAALRSVCLALPEVPEEDGVGRDPLAGARAARSPTCSRVEDGWPPAYARAAGHDGPLVVLMFRSTGPELDALRAGGHPFFAPPWRADEVGLVLTDPIDWDEVTELVTESYCCQAPARLAATVVRPPG